MHAPRTLNLLLPAMLATAALVAPTSAPADAEHGSPGHDMGAASHDMGATEHGMSPAEHAGHTDGHSASSGHGAHGAATVTEERPVALMLGGFAALNALVLLAAALLRRRPAAVKRRETLARVRRAAGAREADPTGEARP